MTVTEPETQVVTRPRHKRAPFSRRITVRVSDDHLTRLGVMAMRYGLSPSTMLRKLIDEGTWYD